MDLQETKKRILRENNPLLIVEHDEELIVVMNLAYHVAVYIKMDHNFGYEHRYCVSNFELAKIAIEDYIKTGEFKYWQKHHNKDVSIIGNKAFLQSNPPLDQYALFEVSWDAGKLREQYPHLEPLEKMKHMFSITDTHK